jgi:DNA-binding beta-propeller fold protein YncE
MNPKYKNGLFKFITIASVWLLLESINPLQAEVTLQEPFGIAVKADGSFYVAEIKGKRIARFDADGIYVGSIEDVNGYGKLKGPFDVALAKSGNLYIADTHGHSVLGLDPAGNLFLKLGTGEPATEAGSFNEPHSIAVNENLNRIYVSDTHNNRIQVFDMQGNVLAIMGQADRKGPGTYWFASGLNSDENGNIYAMSLYGGFINVYDPAGKLSGTIGNAGYGPGEFNAAYGLVFHKNSIWVADTRNSRLQHVSLQGEVLCVIGQDEGKGDDQFNNPSDLGFDAQDNIYVTDWKNDRVVKLSPDGRFIRSWGSPSADMSYQPLGKQQRNLCRGPLTVAVYGEIDKASVDRAAEAGVKTIYASLGFDNRADKNDRTGEEWNIKEQVDYAHQKGIRVVVSAAIYPLGAQSQFWKNKPEFYMWRKGSVSPDNYALSYFFPQVRTWKAKHLAQQAVLNRVDGIMLDYIRYPNNLAGYEPAMVNAFKEDSGVDVNSIAPDNSQWLKFRAKYITLFITELRYELAQSEYPIELSAYVGPDWNQDLQIVARNWRDWVKMGIVDKISLGMYSRDFKSFYDGIQQAKTTCPDRIQIDLMVACWGGNLNTPELLKKGADICVKAGADEFAIFRGDAIDRLNLWNTIGDIASQYKNEEMVR